MRMRVISLLTLVMFVIGTAGCASVSQQTQEHPGAATGAAVGAAGGAVAGSLMGAHGARTETAIIGGLLGALVGGLIGHYAYDVKRSRQETDRKYNYQPSAGVSMRLEDTSVEPRTTRPGQQVELLATYAIMTPSPTEEVPVTETREIKFGSQLVGKPEVTVRRGGGTYTSRVPLTLPSDAKSGKYKVYTTIAIANSKDTRETTFEVR
ncbi:MAG: glycine zipper 2TM domain-containing protein [Candidatus Sulfobium sp.]|jgi:hypothetical protein